MALTTAPEIIGYREISEKEYLVASSETRLFVSGKDGEDFYYNKISRTQEEWVEYNRKTHKVDGYITDAIFEMIKAIK